MLLKNLTLSYKLWDMLQFAWCSCCLSAITWLFVTMPCLCKSRDHTYTKLYWIANIWPAGLEQQKISRLGLTIVRNIQSSWQHCGSNHSRIRNIMFVFQPHAWGYCNSHWLLVHKTIKFLAWFNSQILCWSSQIALVNPIPYYRTRTNENLLKLAIKISSNLFYGITYLLTDMQDLVEGTWCH